jgi:hypothetical protein
LGWDLGQGGACGVLSGSRRVLVGVGGPVRRYRCQTRIVPQQVPSGTPDDPTGPWETGS